MAAVCQDLVRGGAEPIQRWPRSVPSGPVPRRTSSVSTRDGLKTVVAKAAAGDAIWFLATVNRIAEILAARGTPIRWGRGRPVRLGFWRSLRRRCGF